MTQESPESRPHILPVTTVNHVRNELTKWLLSHDIQESFIDPDLDPSILLPQERYKLPLTNFHALTRLSIDYALISGTSSPLWNDIDSLIRERFNTLQTDILDDAKSFSDKFHYQSLIELHSIYCAYLIHHNKNNAETFLQQSKNLADAYGIDTDELITRVITEAFAVDDDTLALRLMQTYPVYNKYPLFSAYIDYMTLNQDTASLSNLYLIADSEDIEDFPFDLTIEESLWLKDMIHLAQARIALQQGNITKTLGECYSIEDIDLRCDAYATILEEALKLNLEYEDIENISNYMYYDVHIEADDQFYSTSQVQEEEDWSDTPLYEVNADPLSDSEFGESEGEVNLSLQDLIYFRLQIAALPDIPQVIYARFIDGFGEFNTSLLQLFKDLERETQSIQSTSPYWHDLFILVAKRKDSQRFQNLLQYRKNEINRYFFEDTYSSLTAKQLYDELIISKNEADAIVDPETKLLHIALDQNKQPTLINAWQLPATYQLTQSIDSYRISLTIIDPILHELSMQDEVRPNADEPTDRKVQTVSVRKTVRKFLVDVAKLSIQQNRTDIFSDIMKHPLLSLTDIASLTHAYVLSLQGKQEMKLSIEE